MKESKEIGRNAVFFREASRFLGYCAFAFFVAELLKWDATNDDGEVKFSEMSYVELSQSFLLLVCSVTCIAFFFSNKIRVFKYIFLLIFGLTTVALIREQDVYFEQFFGHGTWPYAVLLILGFVLYKIYKKRSEVYEQLVQYMATKSYAFMTFAIITVFLFSRLYGRTVFWQAVMEDRYFRSVKNVSEEGIELYGYLFLFYAVIELVIVVLNRQKSAGQM